jgi:hypothetical protein
VNLQNKIIILDEVLSSKECDELIDYYVSCDVKKSHGGTIYPLLIDLNENKHADKFFKISNQIVELMNVSLVIDWCELVKWPLNSQQNFHFDIGSKNTVFTSITYLNDDYFGGETCFLGGQFIKPKKGRTVYFDGNFYKHGVSTVGLKNRYTAPIWYKNANNE